MKFTCQLPEGLLGVFPLGEMDECKVADFVYFEDVCAPDQVIQD
jgi:hypothetical protein